MSPRKQYWSDQYRRIQRYRIINDIYKRHYMAGIIDAMFRPTVSIAAKEPHESQH